MASGRHLLSSSNAPALRSAATYPQLSPDASPFSFQHFRISGFQRFLQRFTILPHISLVKAAFTYEMNSTAMNRSLWRRLRSGFNRDALTNSARTAAATVASLLVARAFRLPENYWAAVSTLIVMQSSLGASLPIAGRRLAGAALGAGLATLIGLCAGPKVWVVGAGVFLLGLICSTLGRAHKTLKETLDPSAYRYAGITLAITILIPRSPPIWIIAAHRFCEVSIGIGVALAMTLIWPERSAHR